MADEDAIQVMMRHEKFDTTKLYIQRYEEDAIDSLKSKKIPFFEGTNPTTLSSLKRPERNLELEFNSPYLK